MELADADHNVYVSGTEEARKAVRAAFADGADCIKIYANTNRGIFSAEEVKVIVEEALRMEKKVAAHTLGDLSARTAVEARVIRSSTGTSFPGVDRTRHGER